MDVVDHNFKNPLQDARKYVEHIFSNVKCLFCVQHP